MAWIIPFLVRSLQKLNPAWRGKATHMALGIRGETEAYFYLEQLGYRIVARNFRTPHHHGEIDLIGWDGEVLCFVEVKTRTDDSFAPPSTAVTREKRRHILEVARRYLRHLPVRPCCRFDIVSVVPSPEGSWQFKLTKRAFTWDSDKPSRRSSFTVMDRYSHRPRRF